MMMNNHPYHLVSLSPWPLLVAANQVNMILSMIKWLSTSNFFFFIMFMAINTLLVSQWWRDIVRESLYEGYRSHQINLSMSIGMIMFIISELWFFISFFWSYFYFSLNPEMNLGLSWPPFGIKSMNYMSIPLLNTLVLLSSGMFITWSHHSILNNNYYVANLALNLSAGLGLYFMIIQGYEYLNCNFSLNSSVFGSSFFILTGFHGIHVTIGLIFILISSLRMASLNFSSMSIYGLEYSAWYWHFVDLVWLFLYTFIYWWGM